MTPNQIFIVALVTAFLTSLVPLIPFAMKLFFQANEQKLINAKLKIDKYKETIKNLCVSAQALFKESAGQARYDWVIGKLSDKSLIPEAELKGFIESILNTARQSFGEEWDKLGQPKTPPPTAPPVP
jgi:hypothetical protein